MKRILSIFILVACIIVVVAFYYRSYYSSVSVTDITNTEVTTTTDPQIEKGNELSECQHYYTYIFPNASEYGTFEQYPVTNRYMGTIAELDLESHAVAKQFYTHHKSALEKGINFAGKYVISEWDFTNIGLLFAVIDAETGKIYPFPYVVDWDYDFRIDSNLIIINPKDTMSTFSSDGDVSCDAKWYSDMKSYYFLFEDGEFKLLGPEEGFDLAGSDFIF